MGPCRFDRGAKPEARNPSGTSGGGTTAEMQDDPWRELPPTAAQATGPPKHAAPREQMAQAGTGAMTFAKDLVDLDAGKCICPQCTKAVYGGGPRAHRARSSRNGLHGALVCISS